MKRHDGQSPRALRAARRALCHALLTMNGRSEMEALLTDLCTPTELEALADRWRVARLLTAGMSYREIHDRTSVSVTTIGRVARYIDRGAGGYGLALDRMGGGVAPARRGERAARTGETTR